MRQIDKSIELNIDGEKKNFILRKPDAFTGVEFLRLLMRLQDQRPDDNLSIYDLISSFTADEMKNVMKSCLNHVYVQLPAGPNPVMSGDEWSYPELEYETGACMQLMLRELSWSLRDFFGGGGSGQAPAEQATPRQNA